MPNMKIPISGIYIIECGNKYYIGMSKDIFSRWQSHYTQLVINRHHSPELQLEFNQNGITNFKFNIIFKVNTSKKNKDIVKRELIDKEKEIMSMFESINSLNKNKKYFKT